MGRIPPGAWRDAPGAIFESGGFDGEKKDLCCYATVKSKSRHSLKKRKERQTRCPGRDDAQ
jgi:hypothetical protein